MWLKLLRNTRRLGPVRIRPEVQEEILRMLEELGVCKVVHKRRPFNGTEGVVGLRRWIEKVEQVFEICKCAEEDKVMVAASTFEGRALTWWNRNVHTLGLVNANHIPWNEFKTLMTTEYFPATKIQRMKQELWTLTLKGDDIKAYNYHFHELALMCPDLVPTEKKKVERQEAAKVYVAALTDRRNYARNAPYCNKCRLHHYGQCPPECGKCHKIGNPEKDYRVRIPGHLRMKCPKGGNRHNEGARVRAYVMGTENPQQNLNVVTGTFLVNDHYACILFDSGAEKSFVSTAFNPFINTAPATLDTSYRVELADGK
ncbi:putative reverse transcriptase domain-containing protein, partial [Tanacetum coccineum]